MQDYASCHTARSMKHYLHQQNITLIRWGWCSLMRVWIPRFREVGINASTLSNPKRQHSANYHKISFRIWFTSFRGGLFFTHCVRPIHFLHVPVMIKVCFTFHAQFLTKNLSIQFFFLFLSFWKLWFHAFAATVAQRFSTLEVMIATLSWRGLFAPARGLDLIEKKQCFRHDIHGCLKFLFAPCMCGSGSVNSICSGVLSTDKRAQSKNGWQK